MSSWWCPAAGAIFRHVAPHSQRPEEVSMFLTQSQSRARAVALMEWRESAELVASRWRTYLDAEPIGRAFAFASYVSALDAEEAAAANMAARAARAAA
jgi:hypothetical protein